MLPGCFVICFFGQASNVLQPCSLRSPPLYLRLSAVIASLGRFPSMHDCSDKLLQSAWHLFQVYTIDKRIESMDHFLRFQEPGSLHAFFFTMKCACEAEDARSRRSLQNRFGIGTSMVL